jgi:putative ATP-dependent endonuclease of OLD family
MFLSKLRIVNFRRICDATLEFQPGLNILVGPNNVGKTAVVDAMRALLAGHDEPYPRFTSEDVHQPKGGFAKGAICFHFVFADLSLDDEADFMPALKPDASGVFEAHISVRYAEPDKSGRLRTKRWCGDFEEVGLTAEMMENLRGVYLPALRDASQGLKPCRGSQLARLLQILADETGRDAINAALKNLDIELKTHQPIVETQKAIAGRHSHMLGSQLAQILEVGLSASDFQRLSSRLSLMVDQFEIEQNGLGFNNLIYMAVVLSELAKNPEAAYRGLIVEEPEAHLHPQLQAVLLRYLTDIQLTIDGEKAVQIFVTSHSPNFASIARLDSLICLVDTGEQVEVFFPRNVAFEKGKREKLERYLDVTRAELFFARRIIFVEGAAELMLVSVLAEKAGYKLREHGVSLISVEGLNFDCFLPLFGEKALKVPVSVITDADPMGEEIEGKEALPIYPSLNDKVNISENTLKMQKMQDKFVKIFHGVKTFEYDLALRVKNRATMISTLKELHPKIGATVAETVEAAEDNTSKAKELFCGMFERKQNNVQKGRFGQALAQAFLIENADCDIPDYIREAVDHVCKVKELTS